jgi:hypothetical protein
MGIFHDSLVKGFRMIVMFDSFGAYPLFGHEFYGWAEEVVEESPFFFCLLPSKNVYLNSLKGLTNLMLFPR